MVPALQSVRTRWVTLALALTVLFSTTVAVLALRYAFSPNCGLIFVDGIDPHRVLVAATTPTAKRATEGLEGFLGLIEVNGVRFDREPRGSVLSLEAQRLVDLREGATNSFTICDQTGAQRSFTLPVEPFDYRSYPYHAPMIGYELVGLLYLFIGVLVW